MKKVNPIITKTVTTTVAASIMISSCYKEHDFEDCVYGPFAENPKTRGVALMDINESNLSEDFLIKARIISKIVNDILINPKEAEYFALNPDEYIKSKELGFKIILSDVEKRALLAFCDENIIKAVKEKDFENFIRISNEKNYFGLLSSKYSEPELRSIFKSDKDYDDFIELVGVNENLEAISPVIFAGVVAVVFLYVAVATIVELGVAVHAAAALSTAIGGVGEETKNNLSYTNEPILKIWTDNNGKISTEKFYSEVINKQVHTIVEKIEDKFPEVDEKKISNIIRLQLEGYYGLRK